MLFYLIMHFLVPTSGSFQNPFEYYSYGIGLNICIELALIIFSFYLFKILKSRTGKQIACFLSILLWVANYLITWCCFWIESFTIAAGLSIIAVVGFDVLCLIILDILLKNKR